MTLALTRAANERNARTRSVRRVPTRHFVLPDCKVAYVANAGASSTAMKSLLATLAGLEPASFARYGGLATSRRQAVHDHRRWGGLAQPLVGADAALARLSASDDWFVFTVVRDPRERLWAAWQARVLRGHPKVLGDPRKRAHVPPTPRRAADVTGAFAEFAHGLGAGTVEAFTRDKYFLPQTKAIARRGVRYTQVYDRREIALLQADLSAHLDRVGHTRELSYRHGPRLPFALTRTVLSGGVADSIERAYAADFEVFGSAWGCSPASDDREWDASAYRAVEFVRAANQRIADLSGSLSARRAEDTRERVHAGR